MADLDSGGTGAEAPKYRAVDATGWRFSTQPCDGDIWFYVSAGPMSGGTFMRLSQARELAAAISAAADDLEGKS